MASLAPCSITSKAGSQSGRERDAGRKETAAAKTGDLTQRRLEHGCSSRLDVLFAQVISPQAELARRHAFIKHFYAGKGIEWRNATIAGPGFPASRKDSAGAWNGHRSCLSPGRGRRDASARPAWTRSRQKLARKVRTDIRDVQSLSGNSRCIAPRFQTGCRIIAVPRS